MRHLFILFSLLFSVAMMAQGWTSEELTQAATSAGCPYLSSEEKEVIKYTNLARMYPRKFADLELPSSGSSYLESLRRELLTRQAVGPLFTESSMYEFAQCFAAEQGNSGRTGHDRYECTKMSGFGWAENCSYGYADGRGIVLQLLIDDGVSSLGHRRNCLSENYNAVGVSIHSHTRYRHCCVMDFRHCSPAPTAYRVTQTAPAYTAAKTAPTTSTATSTPSKTTSAPTTNTTTKAPATTTATKPAVAATATPATTATVNTQKNNAKTAARTTDTKAEKSQKSTSVTITVPSTQQTKTRLRPKERFYNYSGRSFVSILSPGYNYSFIGQDHRAELGILDFRARLFGMSPLDFEMKVNPFSTWFAYRPSMQVYIPFGSWIALKLYAGCETDITYLGQYIIKDYEFDYEQNYFLNAFGGASLYIVPYRCFPLEVRAEYQHPIINTVKPQGMYLSVRLHIGVSKKNR